MQFRKLQSLLAEGKVRTITVDVFDTVLLRRLYPEKLQWMFHGRSARTLLREYLGIDISPYGFTSLRLYVGRVIGAEKRQGGYDAEARLEEIFALMIDMLLTKERRTVAPNKKSTIVAALVREELAIERKFLKPAWSLIRFLRLVREKHGVKTYFLSDMYLSRSHIQELFQHFGIADVFDGGAASSDLGYSKGSGRMYTRILEGGVIGPFGPTTHAHIGDHLHADVVQAQCIACETIHCRDFHHVCYRPLVRGIGCLAYLLYSWCFSIRLRYEFQRALQQRLRSLGPDSRVLFRLGYEVFGPPLLQYLSYLHTSSLFGGRPIYFLSKEAILLLRLFHVLWGEEEGRAYMLPSLSRSIALRAFAYLALTTTAWRDTKGILRLFWWGQEKEAMRDLLESIGLSADVWGLSRFLLDRSDREESVRMLATIFDGCSSERARFLQPLEKACEVVKNELNVTRFLSQRQIIVTDVGWHGSVQILLGEYAALLGWFPRIRGIYLGTVLSSPYGLPRLGNVEGVIFNSLQGKDASFLFAPALWEQVLSRGKERALSFLIEGIEECLHFWKIHVPFAPDRLLHVTREERKRFFSHPSWDEVRLLGPLEHEVGGGLTKPRPLVDMHLQRRWVRRVFFLEPRAFAILYSKQCWQRGFLRWYGLHSFSWLGRCRTVVEQAKIRERKDIFRELYEGPLDYAPLNVRLAAVSQ